MKESMGLLVCMSSREKEFQSFVHQNSVQFLHSMVNMIIRPSKGASRDFMTSQFINMNDGIKGVSEPTRMEIFILL
jgi:hypothetical protein